MVRYSLFTLLFVCSGLAAEPPTWGLPPGESVLPGTLAEAKADRPAGYGPKLLRCAEAFAADPRAKGKGIRVVVLDTGVDKNHPWIRNNLKGTYNAITKRIEANDGNSHGTHCAGIITEALPDCDLYAVKVLSDQGSGSVVDIAHGIDWAVTEFKADVISLSLGGPSPDAYIPPALERAERAGVLVIVAAGNDGPAENTDGYPARYAQSISVAACDENKQVARFSSRGKSVFTLTPGVQINSSLPGDRQGRMSGTSMACPLCAAAAGSWCACSELAKVDRPAAFRKTLAAACAHPDRRTTSDGYGLPDVTKLVTASTPPTPTPPVPNPGPFSLTVTLADLSPAKRDELAAIGVRTFTVNIDGERRPMPPPTTARPISSTSSSTIARWVGGDTLVVACGVPGPVGAVLLADAPAPLTMGKVYRLWHDANGPAYSELDAQPTSSSWSTTPATLPSWSTTPATLPSWSTTPATLPSWSTTPGIFTRPLISICPGGRCNNSR